MKNKYLKAFLSGFLNPFGQPTYQDMISLPPGEITKRINKKIAENREETNSMMEELNKAVKRSKKS
ncbi:MAG: hypothetical protein M1300_07535 [Epsilonproteobacteria bacterium]|nr:hypothetical protein [Campylobacterota bacterium]